MRILEKMSAIERALVLMKVAPFDGLSAQQVSLVAVRTREVELSADQVLGPDTAERDDLHVVMSGRVEVSLNGKVIRSVGPGQSFGLYGLARAADDEVAFRALETTRALHLGRDDFEQTLVDFPEFALALIRTLLQTTRDLIIQGNQGNIDQTQANE